jgi:hypothetical protein
MNVVSVLTIRQTNKATPLSWCALSDLPIAREAFDVDMSGNINERGLGENLDDVRVAQLVTDGRNARSRGVTRDNCICVMQSGKCSYVFDHIATIDGGWNLEQGLIRRQCA